MSDDPQVAERDVIRNGLDRAQLLLSREAVKNRGVWIIKAAQKIPAHPAELLQLGASIVRDYGEGVVTEPEFVPLVNLPQLIDGLLEHYADTDAATKAATIFVWLTARKYGLQVHRLSPDLAGELPPELMKWVGGRRVVMAADMPTVTELA